MPLLRPATCRAIDMPKYLNVTLLLLSYVLVAFLAVAVTALYDRLPRGDNSYGCVRDARIVAQSLSGDKVQMKQAICGGFAYADVVTLSFWKKGETRPSTFFSYERNSSEQNIVWSSNNQLEIDLADVGRIYTKLDQVDGIHIKYRIGRS
jgi:hypothetical protein